MTCHFTEISEPPEFYALQGLINTTNISCRISIKICRLLIGIKEKEGDYSEEGSSGAEGDSSREGDSGEEGYSSERSNLGEESDHIQREIESRRELELRERSK